MLLPHGPVKSPNVQVTRGKFVPEQETDYIFCTIGEKWGFVGSTALILLYTLFIGRVYYLSEKQKSTFNRVFGYSFASILLMHFGINIGMVMGLFPTVGIPLPYFSYGGSSLLAFSIMNYLFTIAEWLIWIWGPLVSPQILCIIYC